MRAIGTLVLAASLILPGAGAWAACAPMTLKSIPGTLAISFADLDGSGGPNVGDKRIGDYGLADADGKTVGKVYWVITVLAVGADGKPSSTDEEGIYVFADGAVFVTKVDEPVGDYEQNGPTVLAPVTRHRIYGGTEAYAGASGTAEITVDGKDVTYKLDLACK